MPLNKTQKSTVDAILEPLIWFNTEKINDFRKESEHRGEDIKKILSGISKVKIEKTIFMMDEIYKYKLPTRNIKDNMDWAREEFRGAIQKYLLGFYKESVISSCNSVEMALLTEHKKRLVSGIISTNDIKPRFTFGDNKALALNTNKGFISDAHIAGLITDIVLTRNMLIHQHNFMSALMQIYKEMLIITPNNSLNKKIFKRISKITGIDLEILFKMIKEMTSDSSEPIITRENILSMLPKQLQNEINRTPDLINNLWDYREFTNQDNINHFNLVLDEFWKSNIKFQLDIFYYLSNKTLNQAYTILKFLKYF
jgi:hypothetical protein